MSVDVWVPRTCSGDPFLINFQMSLHLIFSNFQLPIVPRDYKSCLHMTTHVAQTRLQMSPIGPSSPMDPMGPQVQGGQWSPNESEEPNQPKSGLRKPRIHIQILRKYIHVIRNNYHRMFPVSRFFFDYYRFSGFTTLMTIQH